MEVDGSGYRRARKKAIKEGLEFLQSPLPFAGSDEEYKGYLHRLVCGLRDEGNQLYREGQALRAHEMYSEALGVCAYMHDIEGFPSESGVVEKLYVNRATCLLGMSQYNDALLDCEEALHRNKMSHKALYRKAKALKAIGKPKEAYEVAVQCSCIISNDQEVFKLVQELAVSLGLRVRKAYVRTQNTAPVNGISTTVGNGSISEVSSKMPQEGTIDDIDMDVPLIYTDEDDVAERGHADAGYTEATSQTEPVSSGLSPYADYAPANDAHPAANGVAGAYADTAEGVKAPACEPYDGASLGDGSEEGSAERFGDAAESEGDSDRSVGDGNGDGNGAHPRSELSHAEDELPAGSLAAEPAVACGAAEERAAFAAVAPEAPAEHRQQQQQAAAAGSTMQLHGDGCGVDNSDGFMGKEPYVTQHAMQMHPAPILHQTLPPAFQQSLGVVSPMLPPGAELQQARPSALGAVHRPQRPILVMPSFHVSSNQLPFLQHGACLQMLPHAMGLSGISVPPGFSVRPSTVAGATRLSSMHAAGPVPLMTNGPPSASAAAAAASVAAATAAGTGGGHEGAALSKGSPVASAAGVAAATPAVPMLHAGSVYEVRVPKQGLDSLDAFTDAGAYPLTATRAKELPKEFGVQGSATSFGAASVGAKHPPINVGGLARPTSAAGSPASLVAQPKKSEPSSELFPKIKRADGAAPPGDAFRPQRKPAETAADGAHMKRNAAAVADVHGSMAAVDGSILSLVRNPLESTHEFRQACHLCILGADRSACNTEHKCKKDFLLCRLKSMPNRQWQKVRPRPMKSYSGVYMLCKDIVQGEECRFAGHCTFAYSQEEIDVWTQERKGTLNRNLLFDPFGGGGGGGTGCGTGGGTGGFGGENSLQGSEGGDFSVAGLLRAHGGMFMFYCEECFDKRPRVISKRNKEALKYCTHNPPHIFDEKKCLVHILRGTSVRHLKIRPLHEMCQFDLCRHETRFGCNRQDSCYFAHDIIELKIWVLQSKNGLSQEDITQESKRYLQSLDSPGPNAGNQGMSKPPASTKLQLKLKFVCSQCWKNGQVSEADRNLRYCEAKARHSWTKDRRALLAMSPQRKKWISVRAPPSMRVAPTHYEVCAHVLNGKKCFYIGNCNFAHSEEEREVWMYMKSNCLTDIDEVYKMWLEGNRTPAKDPEDGTSPAGKESSSRICMPTDYAENSGKYCSLCGRNCNSDKQWRQHMSSEKHREKVFEDEQRWKFRFPTGQFAVCERWLGSAGGCKDDGCAYAHGDKELDEWIERRDAIRAKLEEARQQGLLPLNESNFGKYTCLIK
ncbi:zinc finger CCCH domain-containing protein 7A-like isoform X1 [Lampetra fluviatilis]